MSAYGSDIKLGDRYRDDQTGIEGVATSCQAGRSHPPLEPGMRQRSEWPRFPDGRVRERRPNGRGPYWWTCSDPRWSFNHSTEQKCSVFPYEGCAMPDSDCGWEYLPDLR